MTVSGVSVILPVFFRDERGGAALLRAAESVMSQGRSIPVELIVVDDGSRPALSARAELRSLFERPDVRLIPLVSNQGLVYALNAGLTQSRHEWIARIDHDDIWRPGKLRRQCECVAADPDVTLVAGGMRLVHAADPSRDRDEPRGGDWRHAIEFAGKTGCPFPHGTILARKEVYSALGGYSHAPAFEHCEDYALWASWLRFFKVTVLDDVLMDYSVSEVQVSARYAKQQADATDHVRGSFLELPKRMQIPEAVKEVARKLRVPLLEASKMLCRVWRFYPDILAAPDLFDAATVLFPDRSVHRIEEASELLTDRVFCLSAAPPDPKLVAQFRLLGQARA